MTEPPSAALGSDLERGRALYVERRWSECCEALEAAERDGRLEGEDLKRLSVAYYLAGRDDDSVHALVRGHRMSCDLGEWEIATICAFWLFYIHGARGEISRASGWAARTRSTVAEHNPGGSARGYALLVDARHAIGARDLEAARETAKRALAIGVATHDADLEVAARLSLGEALVLMGRGDLALSALDLVHVAMDDDLTPTVAGMAYCAAVATCLALSDLRRAREWTAALTDWCAGQPEVMPYRGQCLADRARILMLGGEWPEAMTEARAACGVLREPLVGLAWYERGELHRLLGEFDARRGRLPAGQLGRLPARARPGAPPAGPGTGGRRSRHRPAAPRRGHAPRPPRDPGRPRGGDARLRRPRLRGHVRDRARGDGA